MDFTDRLQKTSSSNVLPFPAPPTPRHAAGGAPDLDYLPHDIGALRRPVAVEQAAFRRVDKTNKLEERAGLAHDARNLMASLELMSDLLGQPGVLSAGHQQYAGDLKTLTAALSGLVERMAKTPGGPAPDGADATPVCVREPLRARIGSLKQVAVASPGQPLQDGQQEAAALVKSCERLLGAIAGPTVALTISAERGVGVLALGREDMTRVLINLVKNASEAMPKGGHIAIKVRKGLGSTPSALVSVEDNGAGIPAHALGQIFHPGFTSKQAERKWPAAAHHGLGLSIVRELVEAAGGSIRVASALRKGTTFEMKLPCRGA